MRAEPFAFASAEAASEAAVLVMAMEREHFLPPLEAAMLHGPANSPEGAALRAAVAVGALASISAGALDEAASREVRHALSLLRAACAGLPSLPDKVVRYYAV